jgi:inhibitor of KinA
MKIIPASDSSLLIVLGDSISPEVHERVIALFQALQSRQEPGIRSLHPAYASVLIDFDPLRLSHQQVGGLVEKLAGGAQVSTSGARLVSIPVCYESEFGPDLGDVAVHAGISTDEVIRLHCSATYLVYFLGFSPGFAYMGGLPEELHTPRLATPRAQVVAGTVGIAGSQTGVYPVDSAGGWRLIGRTPLRMFDAATTPPTRLQPGDHVKFSAIDRASFDALAQAK